MNAVREAQAGNRIRPELINVGALATREEIMNKLGNIFTYKEELHEGIRVRNGCLAMRVYCAQLKEWFAAGKELKMKHTQPLQVFKFFPDAYGQTLRASLAEHAMPSIRQHSVAGALPSNAINRANTLGEASAPRMSAEELSGHLDSVENAPAESSDAGTACERRQQMARVASVFLRSALQNQQM